MGAVRRVRARWQHESTAAAADRFLGLRRRSRSQAWRDRGSSTIAHNDAAGVVATISLTATPSALQLHRTGRSPEASLPFLVAPLRCAVWSAVCRCAVCASIICSARRASRSPSSLTTVPLSALAVSFRLQTKLAAARISHVVPRANTNAHQRRRQCWGIQTRRFCVIVRSNAATTASCFSIASARQRCFIVPSAVSITQGRNYNSCFRRSWSLRFSFQTAAAGRRSEQHREFQSSSRCEAEAILCG